MTHRELVDSLASALGAAPPRLPPAWLTPAFGSLGELIGRSVRISNRKLRAACDWAPKYPSVREGFAKIVALRAREARADERHASDVEHDQPRSNR